MEAAVQSLKKGKSAGVDNIPAEQVQASGEDVITALTKSCNKTWQTGEWPTPWTQSLVITFPKKTQPAAVPELPNDKPHQSSKQSHAVDHISKRSLYSLFRNVIPEIIFDFLREIGVFLYNMKCVEAMFV